MRLTLAVLLAVTAAQDSRGARTEILRPSGGLPAHVAGAFDIADCQQSATGEYFIFDRRGHMVYGVPRGADTPRKVTGIGTEPGRILDPSSFDLAGNGSFVIADAPEGRERVQVFLESGARVAGYLLKTRNVPRLTLGNFVLNGVGSIEYTGHSVLMSQPDLGTLVTEYAENGYVLRAFGELRRTGHEADRQVHYALNGGLIVPAPAGGYYYVFLAGVPMFRRYDASGKLIFERHIEGTELDPLIQNLPSSWPRRKEPGATELPLILPTIRSAASDAAGNLWISLTVPYTYVYDPSGEKTRVVEFRATGSLAPATMFFTRDGRLLVTPGCYAFRVK
jgi:hypothetical protein